MSRFPLLTRLAAAGLCLHPLASSAVEEDRGIYHPVHRYFEQAPNDRFSELQAKIADGRAELDASGEMALLRSLLGALDIPVSSQSLVFSVTSLQKALISPRRPRALFFNDDTYVGFVPGGRLEVISTDPVLGCNFYIFDRLGGDGTTPAAVRTDECMNCHAPRYMENIPGLVIESVIPGITGGGEKAFRRQQSGHGVPILERFGGWHVTGQPEGWSPLHSNKLIEWREGQALERPLPPGRLSDLSQYPLPTSELLPQLLQEHQVGFVNRALMSSYRAREWQHVKLPEEEFTQKIEQEARTLVRYLLFADEAPLPAPLPVDSAFARDFQANRRASTKASGAALKDLDLEQRLFRHRCSYMVYTPTFDGLPAPLKAATLGRLAQVLAPDSEDPEYTYLPSAERAVIRQILADTLPGFPATTVTSAAPASSAPQRRGSS